MQEISLIRLMWVSAMSLAAGAGYWWGAGQQATRADGKERVMSARARGEVDVNAPRRSPVDVVRETIKGSLDDREQWRQIRGFSEDEVKAAIKELGSPSRMMSLRHSLPAMLFYRWAEIDPVAANEAAKKMFPKRFSGERKAVITAWIKQDGGAAAWYAVNHGETTSGGWDCSLSVETEVADMLVASLSNLDDASAFKQAPRLDEEDSMIAVKLCEVRARKAFMTAESRAAFLAAAAKDPNGLLLKSARESLFREWAKVDAKAALAGLMEQSISEEERKSLSNDIRREDGFKNPSIFDKP
ncbi:MAG: hypothetical protein CFE26_12220 [Verrucomicrobiales bacterium VVV1]|nr:MAG: hypothetical protein CFE26_12220 [Verrucomicrobiales bacterium VVV1]